MPRLPLIGIWKNPDGSCQITQFFSEGQRKKESIDDYINRSVEFLKNDKSQNLKDLKFFKIQESIYLSVLSQAPNRSKRSLTIDDNGVLSFNPNFIPAEVIKRNIKQSIRNKLKSSQSLTDDEIDILIGK